MIKDFLIIGATRYAMGRQTYVVQETVQWLMAFWHEVSREAQTVIRRDLKEVIARDDPTLSYGPLGSNIDRAEWMRLWEKIKIG